MPRLGVNIDHVATIRQARYRGAQAAGGLAGGAGVGAGGAGEPDPVAAAAEAERAGADCITLHLREDRRHIVDRDLELLCRTVRVKLNLEMAATEEMAKLAAAARGVHMCTLVPEGRQEVTTEGGLDVAGETARLRAYVSRLKGAGLMVSAFVDADERQVRAAGECGFDACELHTGPYAEAFAAAGGDDSRGGLAAVMGRLERASAVVRGLGMRLHAGHALNYHNVGPVARIEGMRELHIGHAIVARAVFVGLASAVREMKALVA